MNNPTIVDALGIKLAPAFGHIGNRIKVRSGTYLDLSNPQPDQFTLLDIGAGLSKICRFGGQIQRFYSVAEHSYHCFNIARGDGLSLDVQLAVLFHDATEAFIGDVVKPLKLMLPQYSEVEARIERVIAEKFGIDFEAAKDAIASIDHAVLMAERREIFGADGVKWIGEDSARRLSIDVGYWPPELGEYRWCQDAWRLLREMDRRV